MTDYERRAQGARSQRVGKCFEAILDGLASKEETGWIDG